MAPAPARLFQRGDACHVDGLLAWPGAKGRRLGLIKHL